ncbi:MAG: cadherin domain-containing protein [Candidatus Neomarinimicrobiota bacterium]
MFYKTRIICFVPFLFSAILAQSGLAIKADNAQVQEDESVKINVLRNDNIVDKTNLSIEIKTEPTLGTVAIKDNKIIYTPNANVNGVDKFEYKVDIGTATGSGQVRVNINPVNDAPTGVSLSKNIVKESSPAGTVVGTLNVEDPDAGDKYKFGIARDSREDFSVQGLNLVTKRTFDFETEQNFSVSVQVTDSGSESFVGQVFVEVENRNEEPILKGEKKLSFSHAENLGKIVGRLQVEDPDKDQSSVKYKLAKSDDKDHFKITRSGDIAFLRLPDYENPVDRNKDNVYNLSYRAYDLKDDKLYVDGEVVVKVKDAAETEVITLDKRKFVSWTVDHQPYHILMEDAVLNYMKLRYSDAGDGESADEGDRTSIKEMKSTDQIIVVQQKGNDSEIYEIWYGNGLDFTIIDREKVDWVFSQDIQDVLISKDEYLTSESETVFHESESERLMAGYGSPFSLWHANNFKMSLSSFSMRSNLLQYASNFRVGNSLIGLPGLLAGSSELGVATQRSEFGLRVPFAFDFGTTKYGSIDSPSSEYLGLYARGNIDNLFSTKTNLHALVGFSFYPSSSGVKLNSLSDLSPSSDDSSWEGMIDSTKNINILDSYALVASTVQVPIKFSFIGRMSASPGYHYIKVAHRLKDSRQIAIDNNQELYERAFYGQKLSADSLEVFAQNQMEDGESFTRMNSFYIRFDLVGNIGQKPKFIERISFLDFLQVSKVPFYEFSLQYISGMNMLMNCNVNLSDEFGLSLMRLSKNSALESGNWMPESKFWFGINYRANF